MHAILKLVAFFIGGMNVVTVITFLVFVEVVSILLITGTALFHSDLAVSAIHNHRAIAVTTICTSCCFDSRFLCVVSTFIKCGRVKWKEINKSQDC